MRRLNGFMAGHAVAAVCLISDQLSKWLARDYLADASFNFGLFRFDLVFNTGAAYGLFSGSTSLLLWIGVGVIFYLIVSMKAMTHHFFEMIGYGFILGGAMGNTSDRFFFGRVTDFINIHIIPVFNLADVYLNIGILLIILHVVLYGRRQSPH